MIFVIAFGSLECAGVTGILESLLVLDGQAGDAGGHCGMG